MSADPPRNFTLTTEERIRAITIGVPAWSARKRKIEDEVERLVGELVEAGAALEKVAARFDLAKLNELVRTHNRYYPIEANLPMSRHGYLVAGRIWKPEELYTPARLVALALARARCT
jgi:hypothetical protein